MNNRPNLSNVHILVADTDHYMLSLLKQILRKMGFTNLTTAYNSNEAFDIIQQGNVDIVITEWDIRPDDGISLIQTLRHSESPELALIPVIMLTGRATEESVKYARDCGVTEFLAKPYSIRGLFNRLEHIIDFPRDFIVSAEYVGPDRRRIGSAYSPAEDRRKIVPIERGLSSQVKQKFKAPVKVLVSTILKEKMNLPGGLKEIITPKLLAETQATIDALRDESLQWIVEDTEELRASLHAMVEERDPKSVSKMQRQLLRLKTHAGTFGYAHIEGLAEKLYRFTRDDFIFGHQRHQLVIQKHIEVLQILLAKRISTPEDILEKKLMDGLSELMENVAQQSKAQEQKDLPSDIVEVRL